MKKVRQANTIFTDIGGVLLTNGWDRGSRKKAIELFKLDAIETEERHHLTFDTYEVGKISLDEYLSRVVFYQPRSFTRKRFREFMFAQSKPIPGMLEFLARLRKKYKCKIAVVSNEGRELAEYRIRTFDLHSVADFFIVSSFVHFRKPDTDIFKIALDTAQVAPEEVIYLEDRAMFVQVAETLGIRGLRHTTIDETRKALASMGFR